MRNNLFTRTLSGALIFASACTVAQAEIISYEGSFGLNSNNVSDVEWQGSNNGVSTAVSNDSVNLAGFDSSLGTLTGVEITFNSGWSLGGQIQAWDKKNDQWFSEDVSGAGTSASDMSVELTNPSRSEEEAIRSVSRSCSGSGGWYSASCSNSNTISGSFSESLDLSSIDLDEFLDTVLVLDFERELSAEVTQCGDGSNSGDKCRMWNYSNAWAGTVKVSYTYDVPEPATLALFGLGLMGLGLARRNHKA